VRRRFVRARRARNAPARLEASQKELPKHGLKKAAPARAEATATAATALKAQALALAAQHKARQRRQGWVAVFVASYF
jgi:hypothetical protein